MNASLEASTAIYVAMAVALSVWLGIFIYLWRLDDAVRKLRRRLDKTTPPEAVAAPSATLVRTRNPETATENREPLNVEK